MTARLISDANLQLLRRYDKRPPELQASLLDESGPAYVDAFLTVLRNVTKEETVQYILALLAQVLTYLRVCVCEGHQGGGVGQGVVCGTRDPLASLLLV